MLKIVASNRFKKDLKLAAKRNLDLKKLNDVVDILARQEPLPAGLRDHSLIGDYAGFRGCHIEPDWLLVYCIESDALELYLFRTGTHLALL